MQDYSRHFMANNVRHTIQAKWPIRLVLISGFCGMKQLGVFLLPPGWDASPSQGCPPAVSLLLPIYTTGWREAL